MNEEIIQHLVAEMQEFFLEGFKEVIDYAEFNKKYVKKGIKVLLEGLGKFYEYLDLYIRASAYRKEKGYIVKEKGYIVKEKGYIVKEKGYIVKDKVNKNILTSLGNISYKKTIYVDKTNKMRCLLDEYVGLKHNERLMDDARESIVEEVIDNSYRKAGLRASILDSVHKQTVKNLVM